MRLALLVCIGGLCAVPCGAQSLGPVAREAPLRLTERDAVARFLATDPRIRALSARIDEVRASRAEPTLWPNPSAMFSRESVANTHDTFVLMRQDLPVSGRLSRLRTAGRLAVDAAMAEARFERLQLQSDLREAYAALLLAQQREEALQGSIDALQKLVSVLRAREEGGEGSTYDRMRGQRALVDLEAERSRAEGDRARAQGRLAAYLGPGTAPELLVAADSFAAAPEPAPLPSLVERARANRGDYRAAEISIARFDAERSAATRLRIPAPSLTGGVKRSDIGGTTRSGYQVSVDLAIPLVNRGQAATALAAARMARAQADTESSRLQIEADVRTAHSLARLQQERAARYQASATAIAEPLVRVARVGYEEGELGILELLDAERQALDARVQALELAAAARLAAIELDRVVGQELMP